MPDKLLRCLNSLKTQMEVRGIGEWQSHILVVDDGSTVNLDKVVDWIKAAECVTLKKLDSNFGPSVARNIGIEFAIAKEFSHISFVDSDDYFTDYIDASIISANDVTFFRYIKCIEKEDGSPLNSHISDSFDELSIVDLLAKYVRAPNRVDSLTTCWSKVFSVNLLHRSNLRFDANMRTFEDVHFLLNALKLVNSVGFSNHSFYVNTYSERQFGATFGVTTNIRSLFGFLRCRKPLEHLLKKYQITLNNFTLQMQMHHFLACYYSISMTRLALRVTSVERFFWP